VEAQTGICWIEEVRCLNRVDTRSASVFAAGWIDMARRQFFCALIRVFTSLTLVR
jgi:hypothetical protein